MTDRTNRRFPPPWSVEELNDACFVVRDHNGQALAYVYFEDEPGRRSAAKLLVWDEARRIALNIAKLPELPPSDVGFAMINVSIKFAALGIAVAIISILVYHYGFNNYVAIAGIVAYIIAKAVLWIPRAMRCGGSR